MKKLGLFFFCAALLAGCNKADNNVIDAHRESYDANKILEGYRSALDAEETSSPTLLSEFTTNILTTDKNRYNNIEIVSDRLNGYILAPGEVFSYNEVCGPYGKSNGFLQANILLSDGSHKKGYGRRRLPVIINFI